MSRAPESPYREPVLENLPLPAEVWRYIHAWRFLQFRIDPSKGIDYGGKSRSGAQWARGDDPRRAELRKKREEWRKAIGRTADQMIRFMLEIQRCPMCGEQCSWDDAWCGESKPEGRGCGALLKETKEAKVARTSNTGS